MQQTWVCNMGLLWFWKHPQGETYVSLILIDPHKVRFLNMCDELAVGCRSYKDQVFGYFQFLPLLSNKPLHVKNISLYWRISEF